MERMSVEAFDRRVLAIQNVYRRCAAEFGYPDDVRNLRPDQPEATNKPFLLTVSEALTSEGIVPLDAFGPERPGYRYYNLRDEVNRFLLEDARRNGREEPYLFDVTPDRAGGYFYECGDGELIECAFIEDTELEEYICESHGAVPGEIHALLEAALRWGRLETCQSLIREARGRFRDAFPGLAAEGRPLRLGETVLIAERKLAEAFPEELREQALAGVMRFVVANLRSGYFDQDPFMDVHEPFIAGLTRAGLFPDPLPERESRLIGYDRASDGPGEVEQRQWGYVVRRERSIPEDDPEWKDILNLSNSRTKRLLELAAGYYDANPAFAARALNPFVPLLAIFDERFFLVPDGASSMFPTGYSLGFVADTFAYYG